MKKSIFALAALFLALAVSGGAFAAKGLLTGADIANGSLTGSDIKKGSLDTVVLTSSAKDALRGVAGSRGTRGVAGLVGGKGEIGANGTNGVAGVKGAAGTNGLIGTHGINGTNGIDGARGAAGTNGVAGTNGTNGSNGTNGTNGTNGANGAVTPLSATAGLVALPTAALPVDVVHLDVPAGTYVVLAKTQLAHTGAGDSINCSLKAGSSTVDQISMKTLPALAAVPVALQAVTTVTSPSRLSVECAVLVANGTAALSSLIAMPTS